MNLLSYSIITLGLLFSNILWAQPDSIIGNSYSCLIFETCVEMESAGCMEYNYAFLTFSEKTVEVKGDFVVNCTPKDKSKEFPYNPIVKAAEYKWKMDGDKILIKGLPDFNSLRFSQGMITGKWRAKEIEFK